MIRHLALIMDGNRRWAIRNGLEKYLGHYHGVDAVKMAIDFCLAQKIQYLTLYTFSIENLKRPEIEKKYLFNLLINKAKEELDNFIKQGVKIKFMGDRSLFPKDILQTSEDIESKTAHLNNIQVNILFCYGGQQEIVAGVKKIIDQIQSNQLKKEDITEEIISKNLWSENIPDPDLVIRTGGQQRLSNFMPFQSAYSELYFLDCLWPDIKLKHLEDAVNQFTNRKRNFGV